MYTFLLSNKPKGLEYMPQTSIAQLKALLNTANKTC